MIAVKRARKKTFYYHMPSREQIRALMDRFPDVDHMMAETLLIQHEKGRLDPAWEPQPRAEVTPGSMMVAQKSPTFLA